MEGLTMPLFRIFYTLSTLSEKEETKLREAIQDYLNTTHRKIQYKREKEVIEREFPSQKKALEWAEKQHEALEGIPGDPIYRRYVTVFGACEARDGECITRLEDAFQAEQMDIAL